MEVDEPTIILYWTDSEKGRAGILRKIVLDYTDVMFGYLTPSSASEVELVIQGYIDSAWQDIINDLSNYVPYNGATQNVDLGTHGIKADYVALSLSPVASPGTGQIAYQGSTGSLSYLFDNSNVISNIGQTIHANVHNAEGSPLIKGDVVYLSGSSGNKASVKKARNLSDSTSAKTFGICAENIATNQNGFVICQGRLDGLDTSMYADGDTLYLGATFGSTTNVKPYAPNHLVYVAVVEKSNNGNGILYVRVQNGYELDEIHDVQITSTPVDGQVLTYEASTSLWKPKTPTTSSGITSLNSQTGATQTFATGSSGFDFNISSATNTHTFNLPTASATNRGLLSTTDWSTFNGKEPALTKGNLTEATSSVLTISGGTNAVIGSGTSIQVKQASSLQSGFLSSTDWTTFNNKGSGTITSVTGTSPIASSGGTTPAISIANALADGSTKGAATFNASDFNDNGSGLISLDYANGQSASGSNKGFLTSADWTTFNSKQATLVSGSNIKTVDGVTLLGSGNYLANNNLNILSALGSTIKATTFGFDYGQWATLNTAGAMLSGRLQLVPFYLTQATTLTGVKIVCPTAGNYTGNNYNGVGLYTYSGGTLTLVASTTNDANFWKPTANTLTAKPFSATYSASVGLHYLGLLYSSSAQTTAPSLPVVNIFTSPYGTLDFTNSAKIYGSINSQTSLPASQLMSGVAVFTSGYAMFVY